MSRIRQKFKALGKQGRKALIPFITAGDPNLKETKNLVLALEKAGADIIELGVPFSDPMADGPVIQKADERALAQGTTLAGILKLVERLRKKTQIPILLMGYYNPIFIMGDEVFAKRAAAAGVDAVLIVDLPPEEAGPLNKALRKNGVDHIHLLTPTADDSRMKTVVKRASGFVYYVSLTGVTGANLATATDLRTQISKIKTHTKLPVVVGFGISNPDQARDTASFSDGVVVGSALIRVIEKGGKGPVLAKKVLKFMSGFRKSLD